MAFKIIERFQTIVALITRFAKCGTETADLFGVFGAASRTFFWNVEVIFVRTFFRRCNPVNAEFFPRFIGDPVGRPYWGNFGDDFCLNSFFFEKFNDVFLNIEHRRTSRISRSNHNFGLVFRNHFRTTNNPEFHDVDHGNFGIGNGF